VSKRFIWKRGRRDFTWDFALRFNSALISWLPLLKKKRSPLLSQRTIRFTMSEKARWAYNRPVFEIKKEISVYALWEGLDRFQFDLIYTF